MEVKKKMDLNMNPEPTRRLKALYEIPTPSGYEPPIWGAINQMVNNIAEQRDNAIMVKIREQIGVNVDKDELIRALNYDRNQFNEGYRKGYRDATEKYEEADRWIPVRERLPEEKIDPNTQDFEEVLCTTTWGAVRVCKFGKPIGYNTAHFWHGSGIMDEYITAWRPLPKPYIEPLPDYADKYIREKLGESEAENE